VNQRNAVGIAPDVAKLVRPQNILQAESLNRYAIKTLKVQPATAQESKEKVIFTLLNVDFFSKTNMPKPALIKIAKLSIIPMRIISYCQPC
jgi:hypothetical protein